MTSLALVVNLDVAACSLRCGCVLLFASPFCGSPLCSLEAMGDLGGLVASGDGACVTLAEVLRFRESRDTDMFDDSGCR